MQIPSFRPDEISTTKFFISFLAKKIEVSHGVSDDINRQIIAQNGILPFRH